MRFLAPLCFPFTVFCTALMLNPIAQADYPAPMPSNPTPNIAPAPPIPAVNPVSRSAFTTGLLNREPVNQLARTNAGQTIYYFTELQGLQGHVVTHRWEYNGQFQMGMQFPVSGERWRVQSSKSINPTMLGNWTVTVLNDDGQILRRDTLIIEPSNAPIPAPQPVTAPAPNPAPIPPAQPLNSTVQPTSPPISATQPPALPKAPVIPPPAEKLTTIPAALDKPPATRSEAFGTTETAEPTSPTDKKPIWESINH